MAEGLHFSLPCRHSTYLMQGYEIKQTLSRVEGGELQTSEQKPQQQPPLRHTLFSSSPELSVFLILFYYSQQMSINIYMLYYTLYIM